MIRSKRTIIRICLLLMAFLVLSGGLVAASILFQFLVLGWGASASAPAFSIDIAAGACMLLVGFLALKVKDQVKMEELMAVGPLILLVFMVLKLWI